MADNLIPNTDQVKYADLKTKKAKLARMKEMLKTNDRWLLKGVLTIYQYQTAEEQNSEQTIEHNGVGFSGCDAELFTSISKQLMNRGVVARLQKPDEIKASMFLSPKQEALLRNKMQKYAGQLCRIAEAKPKN